MPNLVLYRKYRPKVFAEIIGQGHIVQTLTNAISAKMISHAYLFSGPYGTGKTTIARILAKTINCENLKNYESCNKCYSCLEIDQGKSIDLVEIDAASHRGIDEIRELRDGIKFSPTKSKYKIFIIDECHQLTKEAANALLKTLEEPPAHAIFILATTNVHKMIPTIISRCQRFDFWKLTFIQIIKRLKIICQKEKIKIGEEALKMIAMNSNGSLRDAEGLLDQALTFSFNLRRKKEIKIADIKNFLGIIDICLISELIDFILEKKTNKALELLNEITKKGYDLQEFAKSLINYLRQVLILKISGPEGEKNPIIIGFTKEEFQKLQEQANIFKEEKLTDILNFFLEAENKMKYSSIPQLPLELAIIEAANENNL